MLRQHQCAVLSILVAKMTFIGHNSFDSLPYVQCDNGQGLVRAARANYKSINKERLFTRSLDRPQTKKPLASIILIIQVTLDVR